MRRFHVENMRLVCHGMVKAGLGNSEQRILQVMSGLESRVLTQSSLQAFSFAIWIRAASASQPASSIVYAAISFGKSKVCIDLLRGAFLRERVQCALACGSSLTCGSSSTAWTNAWRCCWHDKFNSCTVISVICVHCTYWYCLYLCLLIFAYICFMNSSVVLQKLAR